MRNYHKENVEFAVGQSVTHVTDEGELCEGKVIAVDEDSLHVVFDDGEEGREFSDTCY